MQRSINFMRLQAGEMIALGSAQGEVVLDPLGTHPSRYTNVHTMTVMDHPAGMSLQDRVYVCCVARTDAGRPAQYALNNGRPTISIGDEVFLVNAVGQPGHTHFTVTSVRVVPD